MLRLLLSAAIGLLSLFLIPGHSFSQHNHELINAVIKEKGLRWVAGKTKVSQLPIEDKRKLASFIPPGTLAEVSPLPQAPLSEAPAQFDWRNRDGGNYITPVRDQGTCGSCWAFSITAALEAKILIAGQMAGGDIDLAEQFLVSCDTNNAGCSGGNTYSSASFINDTGIPPEACYPYADNDGACGNVCGDWSQKAYKIAGYASVPPSVEAIKNAVYSSGPVACVLQIFDDFLFYTSGVYQHVAGDLLGRHAVTVVGFNDSEQYFIAKNSWGTNWGEGGFLRIAYGEVSSLTAFGSWSVVLGDVIPPLMCPLLSTQNLDFQTLMLPDMPTKSLSLTVANIGFSTIANINLAVIGETFSVSPSLIPALPPGAAQQVAIAYTAGKGRNADRGTLEITCGGVTQPVTLTGRSNTRPRQPVNASPAAGAGVILTPTLSATPFLDEDGDAHLASRWVIWDSAGHIVYETRITRSNGSTSDFDTINKEAFPIPSAVLEANTMYFWQVSYQDDRGAVSAPSDPTSFVIASAETVSPSQSGGAGGNGGGCFIATAVYGSRAAWQVRALSRFRDTYLTTNVAGRHFVGLYYRLSPYAARWIEEHTALRLPLQLILTPLACGAAHPLISLLAVLVIICFCTERMLRVKTVQRSRFKVKDAKQSMLLPSER